MGGNSSKGGPPKPTKDIIKNFNKMKIKKGKNDDVIPIDVVRQRMEKSSKFIDATMIEHILNYLDADHDGTVSQSEFSRCWGYWKLVKIYTETAKRTGSSLIDVKVFEEAAKHHFYHVALDDAPLKVFLSKLDQNGDGKISLDEIKNAYQLATEWKIFNDIDANAKGSVRLKDCYQYFVGQNFPKVAIEKAFKEVDVDNSKDLDFGEFQAKFLPVLHKRRRESMITILAQEDKDALAQFVKEKKEESEVDMV